ncbi:MULTISPECIES: ribonuclease E inhibitor RraB [unclassified Acinetobacter]|uniref:ribonuclease E inhibitor RraB n=1 Tax=unclassified Acinetobacter TaxID=196816 RepID=UPI0029342999|nr:MULTISPECIES: ribonuclease E inhibitor RraB [unclassified Acinetobacter]WOE33021.1 ribonuclease E inhibitor RraB [Acinetobacter sp. SAAs470]WOE38499.1 ribonuclease E inhibitor RraB [Acinetobacter sp. SAAs474]
MIRDDQQFPHDDNGDVLWQMYQDGDDLSEAHEIEYSLAVQHQQSAERCALHLLHQDQKITLSQDDESDIWFITIYLYMEPIYADIVAVEQWLTDIADQYDAEYDGWGCMAYVYDEDEED